MRHTLVQYAYGRRWGYINDPREAYELTSRTALLALARQAPIEGEISVWFHNSAPPDTAAAVTIGHNHNLDADLVRCVCTGTWDECWPVFEAYANLI